MIAIKNTQKRRQWCKTGFAMLALGWVAGMAQAQEQDWPSKPVRIVLAIGAGSSGDTLARMLAPKLESLWKQPVIVENKPGASGVLGTEFVVRATDGHTLLLGTQSSFLPKYTLKGMRFDPTTDLVPVRKVLNYELVIATNAETAKQANSLRDLITYSKKNDKGIFLAGLGPVAVFNLSFAILNQQLGMQYSAINYSNVNDANLSLVRNDTQFIVNAPGSLRQFSNTGTVVPLAAISAQRYSSLPDVPTLAEATGYKGYIPLLWTGFFVPKNTPTVIVERINRDVRTVLNDEEFRKQIEEKLRGSVPSSSPDSFAREIHEELTVWQNLFKTLNIQPE